MKVALVQLNAGENKYKNINKACSLVISAAQKGASRIVLPEVFNYRGPLLDKKLYNDIAEDLPGESIIPLQKIAVEENTNILAGSIYIFIKKFSIVRNKYYCALCST